MNAKIYNGNVQPNPKEFKMWVNDEGTIKTWNGTEWVELSGGSSDSGGCELTFLRFWEHDDDFLTVDNNNNILYADMGNTYGDVTVSTTCQNYDYKTIYLGDLGDITTPTNLKAQTIRVNNELWNYLSAFTSIIKYDKPLYITVFPYQVKASEYKHGAYILMTSGKSIGQTLDVNGFQVSEYSIYNEANQCLIFHTNPYVKENAENSLDYFNSLNVIHIVPVEMRSMS